MSRLDEAASLISGHPVDVDAVLAATLAQRDAEAGRHMFFPTGPTGDFRALRPLQDVLWNNIGSAASNPPGGNHTKSLERALLAWAADLFDLPADDWWGNATTGGTAGNRAGLLTARDRFPRTPHGVTTAVAYYSAAAHYSVPKMLHELNIPAVRVGVDTYGEMDYDHLASVLRPEAPAIVVVTAGTTMTEAVDDPRRVTAVLDASGIVDRYLHCDGALSAIPLALDKELTTEGVDSISLSGYKFLGTPRVCGLVVGRNATRRRTQHISYIAAIDDTPVGSIDGLPIAMMWYAVATAGNEGLRNQAHAARRLAAYASSSLNAIGWPAWRHPWAFTVVFPTPPLSIQQTWPLATDATGQSHLVCMPRTSKDQVDAFVEAMAREVWHRLSA
ncbi:pyridoxal-dependent decarboxylase [Actinoplanes sp. N902-109]|uniref:pyridoxal-dependent decarboxylase n=1 Tax=Actinoplanes sp. (strain N902-109) TaxID=649831 RepID=UPI0003295547|nr:pyridoxal-dependent decarboxylase [Actinoplanes sp. N902-109]AGL13790.1 histidine decarboxylase [Actinoplanes sp. N902-109]